MKVVVTKLKNESLLGYTFMLLMAIFLAVGIFKEVQKVRLGIKTEISTVKSEAVSGDIKTKVEANKNGTVTLYTDNVMFEARRDIRKGEEFEVDLGIHSVTTPVQFTDTTIYANLSGNGLGLGLSINKSLLGTITYGIFGGVSLPMAGNRPTIASVGLNLGYYWEINKHMYIGYDFLNSKIALGVGLRW